MKIFLTPSIFIIFGLLSSLLVTTIVPLSYSHRPVGHTKDRILNRVDFSLLLQSYHFRNIFYDFLSEQFCQENLQFYEVVNEWKTQADSPAKVKNARSIYETFVLTSSLCQVNVEAKVRENICKQFETEGDNFSDSIFDECLAEIIHDMYMSSFRTFKSSGLYVDACTEMGQIS